MNFLNISTIFSQKCYYSVPDYQRDYEWTNAQNSTLLEDIFTILDNPSITSDHFFGALVTVPCELDNATNRSIDFNEFNIPISQIKHVVDGQQRLTSFSILISVLKNLIINDSTVSQPVKDFYGTRQLHGFLFGDDQSKITPMLCAPRLILNGNTGNRYNNSLDSRFIDGSNIYRGAKRLKAAYKTYEEEITKKRDEGVSNNIYNDNEDFYIRLINIITTRLTFVEIDCNTASDAFQVFDSLNGKGLDLTAADRIKNIFISWAPRGQGAQQWSALVNTVGEEFLSSFFVGLFFYKLGRRISKNKLPEEFRKVYQVSAKNDFLGFYQDILSSAELYSKLRLRRTGNLQVNEILEDFKALKVEQVYVILFATISQYGKGVLKQSEYLNFIKKLFTLIVRMQVCDKSMNKLDHLFSQCIVAMKNKSAKLADLTNDLKTYITTNVPDNLFVTAFEGFAPSDSRVSEVYLRYIENYLRTGKQSRNPVDRTLSVEHIIPQKLTDIDEWYGPIKPPSNAIKDSFTENVIENIGNKLLLYIDDNASASNKYYSDKLNIYQNGKMGQTQGTPVNTFELVKELISNYPSQFNHTEVEKRAKQLAQYAKVIWTA